MYVLIGIGIVFVSILVGYTMHGGKVAALMQYTEFIIIGGAAFGSVVVGNSLKGAIGLIKSVIGLLKGNPYKPSVFLELLQAMYDVFSLSRVEGLLALEKHAENPHESELFQKYKAFASNHHALDLFADTLKVVVMGGVSIYDLSDMMEMDLDVRRHEAMKTTGMLTTVADSMPGFGIVAAVLGVVITMQAIGGPPEQVGEKVAAALVGTFLGVLLAYGIFAPLAKATEHIANCEMQYLGCIKNALVAFARGDAPLICVEFARRNIEPELRPSFAEMEEACRNRKKADSQERVAEAA
ncbi:MAG: flagellar motor stator protein MotA [Armatimonadetes bacterium]|nr:flagellar motor stator protein MotA [Armatimonadota bacterium]